MAAYIPISESFNCRLLRVNMKLKIQATKSCYKINDKKEASYFQGKFQRLDFDNDLLLILIAEINQIIRYHSGERVTVVYLHQTLIPFVAL